MNILVTGGAGFIGSNFIHLLLDKNTDLAADKIVCLDMLTYAGRRENLDQYLTDPRFVFAQGDIADRFLVPELLETHQIDWIVHFAAESHVDRSIDGPGEFIQTNVVGTHELLSMALEYYKKLSAEKQSTFRFHHVSTDEVFGSLKPEDPAFCETTPYCPNSPYSASKAGSDHLVNAYHHTYGFPILMSNCSNNYGPYQFPEKLIPRMISNALEEKPLPIYGDGLNIRDWLYVEDHCTGILKVLQHGRIGETYCIGGNCEKTNIVIVDTICDALDKLRPRSNGQSYKELKTFVKDRPGHDRRYAIDISKINTELQWSPAESFESGIQKTIEWYLGNTAWTESIAEQKRLGLG